MAQTGCDPGYRVHFCQHEGGHDLPSFAAAAIFQFLFESGM
jgi:hypothetical protein